MVMTDRRDDQFIGLGGIAELFEPVSHLDCRPAQVSLDPVLDQGSIRLGPGETTSLLWRRDWMAPAAVRILRPTVRNRRPARVQRLRGRGVIEGPLTLKYFFRAVPVEPNPQPQQSGVRARTTDCPTPISTNPVGIRPVVQYQSVITAISCRDHLWVGGISCLPAGKVLESRQ